MPTAEEYAASASTSATSAAASAQALSGAAATLAPLATALQLTSADVEARAQAIAQSAATAATATATAAANTASTHATSAASSAVTAASAAAPNFVAATKAALRSTSALKLLLDAANGVTFVSGSDVATWTSTDPAARVFSNYSSLYAGKSKYVTRDVKGMGFWQQTGLNYDGVVLSQTNNFAIHWTAEFPAPDFTFATIAARDAAYNANSWYGNVSITTAGVLTINSTTSGTFALNRTVQAWADDPFGGIVTTLLSGTLGAVGSTYQLDTSPAAVQTSKNAYVTLYPRGTVVKVTADTNVTPATPRDVLNPMDASYTSQLVNGYYSSGGNGFWNTIDTNWGNTDVLWSLSDSTSAAGGTVGTRKAIWATFNRIGQIEVRADDGASLVTLRVPGRDVRVVSGPQSFGLVVADGIWRLLYQGAEVDAVAAPSGFANLTNLNRNHLNGRNRQVSLRDPVNGDKWHLRTFQIDEGGTHTSTIRSVDAHARYNATPRPKEAKPFYIVMVTGQSEANGDHSVTGGNAWLDARGWNGNVSKDGPSSGAQSMWAQMQSHGALPNVFCARGPDFPADIGAVAIKGDGSGGTVGSVSHCLANVGGTNAVETIEWGFFAQLLKTNPDGSPVWPQAVEADWGLVQAATSGATLAQISALSAPAKFLHTLRSQATANLTCREQLYRGLAEMVNFAQKRGQRPVVVLLVNSQGKGDTSNTGYTAAALTDFANLDTSIKALTGQAESPIYFRPQLGASDGTDVWSNITPAYFDQQVLDIIAGRGNLPIFCPGSPYPFCRHIHHYSYVGWGELWGDRFARIKWGGEDGAGITFTAARVGNSVRLTYNKPVAFVDTSGMGIDGREMTGAVSTYGFWYSGGGLTITGVTLTTSTQVDIALSGTPAVGHLFGYMGPAASVGNVRSATQRLGQLPDIDRTQALSAGVIPYYPGTNWDISEWALAQKVTLS